MWKPKLVLILSTALICLPVLAGGHGAKLNEGKALLPQNYQLLSSVMSSGGMDGLSPSFRTMGTLGQPTPIGNGTSASSVLFAGFWGGELYLGIVGVIAEESLETRLMQNSPNPFSPSTTIRYVVGEANPVTLTIYNIKGERIRSLVQDNQHPGRYAATWNGTDDGGRTVSAGAYFCRIRIGGFESVKKMLLIR